MPAPTVALQLSAPSSIVRPGKALQGLVLIRSAAKLAEPRLVLTLFWTHSSPNESTRSPEVVREELPCHAVLKGSREVPFSVLVPNSPYSFDGKLFRIRWHVEARLEWADGSVACSTSFVLAGEVLDVPPPLDDSDGVQSPMRVTAGPAEAGPIAPEPLAEVEASVAPMDIARGGTVTCRFWAEGSVAQGLKARALSARARLACREVSRGETWLVEPVHLGDWVPIEFSARKGKRLGLVRLQVPFNAATTLEGQDELLWTVDFELRDSAKDAAVEAMSYKFKVWEPEALAESAACDFSSYEDAESSAGEEEEPVHLSALVGYAVAELGWDGEVTASDDGVGRYVSTIEVEGEEYLVVFEARDLSNLLDVFIYSRPKVPPRRFGDACLLANSVNRKLPHGRFVITSDNLIQYNHCIDVEDGRPSTTMFTNMLRSGVRAFNRALPSFRKLISSRADVQRVIAMLEAEEANEC